MAKNHRGNEIAKLPNHGRGTCPVCGRTGIKVIREVTVDTKTVKVCKYCKDIAVAKLSA